MSQQRPQQESQSKSHQLQQQSKQNQYSLQPKDLSHQQNQYVKSGTKDFNYDKFLLPISITLAGLMIFSALFVCYSMIIKKTETEFVTKSNLKKTIAEAIQEGLNIDKTANQDAQEAKLSPEQLQELYSKENIVFGDKSRKVTFIEFSDPSCPFCHAAAGKNPELSKQMGSQFILVKDGGTYEAPVEEMKKLVDENKASYIWFYAYGHGNGELGAQAMYCAYEKGKFWDVHDLLFSGKGYNLLNEEVKNDKANSGKLAEFLKDAIDPSFMKSCLESGKYAQKIQQDNEKASSIGVRGTPGFFVNTTNFPGAVSFSDMKATVDAALKI